MTKGMFSGSNYRVDRDPDEKYLARCLTQLRQMDAPLEGWRCIDMYDITGDDWVAGNHNDMFTCELCRCSRVRFIHVMNHDQFDGDIHVGCICAGVMEGDTLAAKNRERKFKNRNKRKQNFIKRKWRDSHGDSKTLLYREKLIRICRDFDDPSQFIVIFDGRGEVEYKGKPITNFLSAVYAAFDLADPIQDIYAN